MKKHSDNGMKYDYTIYPNLFTFKIAHERTFVEEQSFINSKGSTNK